MGIDREKAERNYSLAIYSDPILAAQYPLPVEALQGWQYRHLVEAVQCVIEEHRDKATSLKVLGYLQAHEPGVADMLRKTQALIGDPSYVAEVGFEYLRAEHVRAQALTAITVAGRQIKACPADKIDEELSSAVAALIESADESEAATAEELFASFAERESRARSGEEKYALKLPTGLDVVDSLMGGFSPGHYTVIAAKRKMGKSRLAARLAYEMAQNGWSVDFYSLEMTASDLGELLTSMISERSQWQREQLDQEDYDRAIATARGKVPKDLRFFTGINSISAITRNAGASATRADMQGRPLAIFVDYLQLVTAGFRTDYENVSGASLALARLARKLNIAVVVTAQFNRESGDGEPKIHQLRGSGQIEQDANEAFIFHRPGEEKPEMGAKNLGVLRLALNRHGDTGSRAIESDLATCRFEFEGGASW